MIPINDIGMTIAIYNKVNKSLSFNHEVSDAYKSYEFKQRIGNIFSSGQKISMFTQEEKDRLIILLGSLDDDTYFAVMEKMTSEIMKLEPFRIIDEEMNIILNTIHDDILITDGQGKIVRVSPSFENMYGVSSNDILGKSVLDLEIQGIFKPSVTAKVLEKRKQITMMQENKQGRKIIVTATPIINAKGEIVKVFSFSRDLTDFLNLKDQYAELEEKMEKYSAEISELREKHKNKSDIIGSSKCMRSIFDIIEKVSKYDANILIEGKSGVGKTMFAKLIHTKSNREQGPFIEISCGSIPENLLESELFGYEKGAFTGASTSGKVGLIELAEKGTLFLDEIGELSLNLQTKLLKVIQDKKIIRIGSTKEMNVDFRLITATNRKLNECVENGRFRQDLYYRLNVIFLSIPPLREREEDIFNLIIHFMTKYNAKYGLNKSLSPGAADRLNNYEWPGNIRELENIIERVILTADNQIIEIGNLPENIQKANNLDIHNFKSLQDALEQTEREIIKDAYAKHKTTTGVAKELGISQPTAVRKIYKYIERNNTIKERQTGKK